MLFLLVFLFISVMVAKCAELGVQDKIPYRTIKTIKVLFVFSDPFYLKVKCVHKIQLKMTRGEEKQEWWPDIN